MRFLALLVALCAVAMAVSGCTTLLMGGFGPTPYAETSLSRVPAFDGAKELLSVPAVEELKPLQCVRLSYLVDSGGAIVRVHRNRLGQTLVTATRQSPMPQWLLLWNDRAVAYRPDGVPIAWRQEQMPNPLMTVLVGPLFYWRRAYISSGGVGNRIYDMDPASATEFRYNHKDAWMTLFGLFGLAEVNGRRYVQLFWIPIPLGATRPTDRLPVY